MTSESIQKKLRSIYETIEKSTLSTTQKETLYKSIIHALKTVTKITVLNHIPDESESFFEDPTQQTVDHWGEVLLQTLENSTIKPTLLKSYDLVLNDISQAVNARIH